MRAGAFLLLAAAAFGQAPLRPAALISPGEKPGVSAMAMAAVEKKLDKKISMMGGSDPIQLLGLTRGLYIGGFGVVLTQEISLVPTPFPNPFRQVITPQETTQIHQRKIARLPVALQTAREMWKDAAEALNTVPDEEQIVLALRLLYQSWEDTKGLPAQLVVKATRADGLAGNLHVEEQ